MPRFLKSGHFWAGAVVGMVVGPWMISKIAPGMKAKMPQG